MSFEPLLMKMKINLCSKDIAIAKRKQSDRIIILSWRRNRIKKMRPWLLSFVSFEPLLTKMKIRDKILLKKHFHSQRTALGSYNYSFPEPKLHKNDAALIPFLWLWLCLLCLYSRKRKIRDKILLKSHSHSQRKALGSHHYSFSEPEPHQNDAAPIFFARTVFNSE
jgi:hypothetical protein